MIFEISWSKSAIKMFHNYGPSPLELWNNLVSPHNEQGRMYMYTPDPALNLSYDKLSSGDASFI